MKFKKQRRGERSRDCVFCWEKCVFSIRSRSQHVREGELCKLLKIYLISHYSCCCSCSFIQYFVCFRNWIDPPQCPLPPHFWEQWEREKLRKIFFATCFGRASLHVHAALLTTGRYNSVQHLCPCVKDAVPYEQKQAVFAHNRRVVIH